MDERATTETTVQKRVRQNLLCQRHAQLCTALAKIRFTRITLFGFPIRPYTLTGYGNNLRVGRGRKCSLFVGDAFFARFEHILSLFRPTKWFKIQIKCVLNDYQTAF